MNVNNEVVDAVSRGTAAQLCQAAVQVHAPLVPNQPAIKAELDCMHMHAVVEACSHIDARTPRTRPWRAFINGRPLPKGFETKTLRKTSTAKLSVEASCSVW